MPGREDALPFLVGSAAAGLATLAVSAVAFRPRPPLPPSPTAEEMAAMGETEEDPPPPTSVTAHVVADVRGATVGTPPGLTALYVTGTL